mmetsp:Transcript_53062/g.119579  ORF Transcript_53062/g.119579 Transcript_53062/m.119579 type:complete len:245 (-) Transcript_53062:130-864(-)|eukprot:CAMPEP_0197935880 /NCGR_PEP_ID=MMETSP1439-20131203/114034_1 /TAXON_ID=66791 /ORGANISM="Gonyaulax spinifera, Strain CCMP409" /LENGTH=244 /DNA_ID=CAMNT_0043558835 /DNA_START=35 /DNA_END=769 /DNA_ORIENTATION=+
MGGGWLTPALAALTLLAEPTATIRVGGGDPCACKSWAAHFEGGGGNCSFMTVQYCKGFYLRVPEPICMNYNWGIQSTKQAALCPVSKACQVLNGGREDRGAKYRTCAPEERRTSSMMPMDLMEYAKKYSLDSGILARASYPMIRRVIWKSARSHFLNPKKCKLGDKDRAYLDRMFSVGKPMIVDSGAGVPPYAVMAGKKVWEVTYNETWIHYYKKIGDVWNYPFNITIFTCLVGCESLSTPGVH